jgi:aspartyl/asparaginyl beta-hydroxylase (cupin superfamily)
MRGALFDAQGNRAEAASAYSIALTRRPPADRMDEAMRRAVERAVSVTDSFAAELAFHLDSTMRPEIGSGAAAPTRRMNHFLDHLSGRRRPYWPQPTNFFYPGLPAIEIYDRENFPWIEMVEDSTDAVRGELLAVLRADEGLEPYMQRPADMPVQQWGELNHNLKWSAYHFALMGKLYEEHRRACPKTAALLDQVPFPTIQNRSPAALFSILKPKTHIPAHHGAGNVRLLCHLPLILPPGCRLRVGNSIKEWRMGEAFVFDDTIEHEAWNDSDELRAVLIFDIWNPSLTADERDFISRTLASIDGFA